MGNGTGTAVLVCVQTMRGNAGHSATLALVQAAVTKHNATAGKGKVAHAVTAVTALPNNTKGMQWQLALLATLARKNGATMVRLSVHNGAVALCGPASAIAATQAAMLPAYNALVTAATAAYSPACGNRVGYLNAWLCGAVAGMQVASKVTATLQYGLGYLYPFAAPSNGAAYATGQAAYATAPTAAPKPRGKRAPKVTAPLAVTAPQAAPQAPTAAPQTAPQGGTQAA